MDVNAQQIWEKCLLFIKDNLNEQVFQTWFLPIKPKRLNGNVLNIQVPSRFFYEWLEEHYIELLRTALTKELGEEAKLVYSIMLENKFDSANTSTIKLPSVKKVYANKNQMVNADAPVQKQNKLPNPFVIPGIQKINIESQLNPSYNFSTFVEGEGNKLARTAGLAVAKRPGGTSFNPLFIYGGVGLGKTHLAHAIGVEVKENLPNKTVLYVSTEKFVQQYMDSLRKKTVNDFIHFYQMVDVLIVDDVQFLSKKKSTQEVFFQIFNHLHQSGKQLILTSDKAPVDIRDVEQRLLSRFKWGLSADLTAPGVETRKKIIESKLYHDGIEFPEPVIDYIAETVKNNVRELEGALISIIAQSSLNKKEITVELAQKTLDKFVRKSQREISIDIIQEMVSDFFTIPLDLVQSKIRKRDVVQARQISMYFAKKYTNASLSVIGTKIGKRDHATVLHACKVVRNLIETDKIIRGQIEEIECKITTLIES